MWDTNWEARYQANDTPWEDEDPSPELLQLFGHFVQHEQANVLEVGCGKGINAPWVLEQGHAYLGIDAAPAAIAQAKQHVQNTLEIEDAEVCFQVADIMGKNALEKETYDVIFDKGLLHIFHEAETRKTFSEKVASHLKPQSIWISISGNADNPDTPEDIETYGLPRLSASDLISSVEENFQLHYMARCHYGTTPEVNDFYGWACVFQKRG